MKCFNKIISLIVSSTMILGLCACSDTADGVKEYDSESIIEVLTNDLGIRSELITHIDVEDIPSDMPYTDYIVANYNDTMITVSFFEAKEDAKEIFDASYSEFEDSFNQNGLFDGDYITANENDYGYIVVDGENMGSDFLGDRYSAGEVSVAMYRSGAMVIAIQPTLGSDLENVDKVIDALGYPNV